MKAMNNTTTREQIFPLTSILLVLLLHLIPFHADAQSGDTDLPQAYSFGKDVRVREAPNLNARVITKLNIGEPVTITGYPRDISEYEKIGYYSYPWVSVRTSGGDEGFVWAGLLAHYVTEQPLLGWGEGQLMLGPVTADPYGMWEFRHVVDGRLVHSVEFQSTEFMTSEHEWIGDEFTSTDVNIIEPDGFSPPLTLVEINEGMCGCGCVSRQSYFVWDGSALEFVFGRIEESSPYIIDDFSILFPDDHGVKNEIRIVSRYAEPREGETETREEDAAITEVKYHWDGRLLHKLD